MNEQTTGVLMAGFGETLRQARAQKGVTLREVEQATRINRHHLAALEDENFAALPPLIYQRGIVRNYAVYLDLDASRMLSMFEESIGHQPGTSARTQMAPPIDMPSHWAPNFAIIAFGVVLSAIVFAWAYSIWIAPPSTIGQPTTIALSSTKPSDSTGTSTRTAKAPTPPAIPTVPPTAAPVATTTPPSDTQTSNSISGRSGDNTVGQTQATSGETTTQSQPAPTAETFVTGFSLTASQDVTVRFTVDGNVVYDGVLGAGQTTDQFVGSAFNIDVSDGASVQFVNACGQQYAPSDAHAGQQNWQFPATKNSCPVSQ